MSIINYYADDYDDSVTVVLLHCCSSKHIPVFDIVVSIHFVVSEEIGNAFCCSKCYK